MMSEQDKLLIYKQDLKMIKRIQNVPTEKINEVIESIREESRRSSLLIPHKREFRLFVKQDICVYLGLPFLTRKKSPLQLFLNWLAEFAEK